MKQQWQQYKEILNTVVKPALGCTEPYLRSLRLFSCAKMLVGTPDKVRVYVSDNLYKNWMHVFVPGTEKSVYPLLLLLVHQDPHVRFRGSSEDHRTRCR